MTRDNTTVQWKVSDVLQDGSIRQVGISTDTFAEIVRTVSKRAETTTDENIVAVRADPTEENPNGAKPKIGGIGKYEVATRWADSPKGKTMAKIKFEDIDVSQFGRIELMKLSAAAEAQLVLAEEAEKDAARAAVEKVLEDHGFDWTDVYVEKPRPTRAARGSKPKKWTATTGVTYAHPDDATLTWVGSRGSRDAWVTELLAEGREPVVVEV